MPSSIEKLLLKEGNENFSRTLPPLNGIRVVAISSTDDPPLAPVEVAITNIGLSFQTFLPEIRDTQSRMFLKAAV